MCVAVTSVNRPVPSFRHSIGAPSQRPTMRSRSPSPSRSPAAAQCAGTGGRAPAAGWKPPAPSFRQSCGSIRSLTTRRSRSPSPSASNSTMLPSRTEVSAGPCAKHPLPRLWNTRTGSARTERPHVPVADRGGGRPLREAPAAQVVEHAHRLAPRDDVEVAVAVEITRDDARGRLVAGRPVLLAEFEELLGGARGGEEGGGEKGCGAKVRVCEAVHGLVGASSSAGTGLRPHVRPAGARGGRATGRGPHGSRDGRRAGRKWRGGELATRPSDTSPRPCLVSYRRTLGRGRQSPPPRPKQPASRRTVAPGGPRCWGPPPANGPLTQ